MHTNKVHGNKVCVPMTLEVDLDPDKPLTLKHLDEPDKRNDRYQIREGAVKMTLVYIIEDENLPPAYRGKRLVVTPAGLKIQGYLKD